MKTAFGLTAALSGRIPASIENGELMAASPADKEVLDYQVPRRILNLVETTCSAFRLDEKQIRILDFGCGRGKTLARLRQMGLDVRGVDIDRQRAKDARGLLSRLDAGSDDDVAVINGDGKIPFADEYFHCRAPDSHANLRGFGVTRGEMCGIIPAT